eukprot:TRINITY_DN90_c4_g1_i1.p1 TRINITY_DN90_c4_g1~~TRINITY_DN90_c4_g1_i1.p1  ORF type:complete len:407 (+),score=63.57 TRINITY_DN90_c4_g1_i1:238-1458(+)
MPASFTSGGTHNQTNFDVEDIKVLGSKVPTSLSHTPASTMMYQFQVKPKPRKIKKQIPTSSGSNMSHFFSTSANKPPLPINLRDYEFLQVLGIGTYGKVQLVRFIPDNTYYCIKILKRYTIFRHKQIEHIQNEKSVLSNINHPGVVKLYGTCNDKENLYLLLEYVPGGELFTYIRKYGQLNISTVRYYAAELVLVLEYMHSKGLVYRDLKPENILLDIEGHIKLTDFGFAKFVQHKTWTMCGTPDYLAPEVILGQGHGKAVDWWSLGILIFEMLAGYPPFTDDNTLGLFSKIQEPEKLTYPQHIFPPEATDLIKKLLVVDPSRRLGMTVRGTLDIQQHPFFQGVDWVAIHERRQMPPIIPTIKSADDTTNYTEGNDYLGTTPLNDVPDRERDVPIPPDAEAIFNLF